MLRTGKQVWEASAKRQALGIRQEELDFHLTRYTILITQSAVLVGFSFESIVHLEPPEGTDWRIEAWFFGSLALAFMTSVYVVVCGSFLTVLGSQLALLGEAGDSLERAVHVMRSRRVGLFASGFVSIVAMMSAGMALAWIKMGPIASIVTVGFIFFGGAMLWTMLEIWCQVGSQKLVTGSTKFFTPQGYFDLATLQPSAGRPDVLADKTQEIV